MNPPPVTVIDHPDADMRHVAVEVWHDPLPDHPTVVVEIGAWGQELHVPVGIARQVAAAILATVPE